MKRYQPAEKVINAVEEYIHSPIFQSKIHKLREKIGIPVKEGLPFTDKDEVLKRHNLKRVFYHPQSIIKNHGRTVNLELRKIIKDDFPIGNLETELGFRIFFYHNLYIRDIFESGLWVNNMCKLVEARNEFLEYSGDDKEFCDMYIQHQENMTKTYPIALYIHAESSQRDIVEYIRAMWPAFELFRKEFRKQKSLIGKVKNKKKSIRERNNFIYENRHFPSREILSKVYDKFGPKIEMDQGYIGKIISLERKKRKEL